MIERTFEWVLISIVIEIDEPVIQQESGITLFPVRIIDLFATLNVVERLNNEPFTFVAILPRSLPWASMVQHISVRDKGICLVTIDRNSKYARCDHHTVLTVLFKWELLILRDLLADQLIVRLDILYFIGDLNLEWRANQPLSLLFGIEDWEVSKTLGKDVNKLREWRIRLSLFLHNQCGEE